MPVNMSSTLYPMFMKVVLGIVITKGAAEVNSKSQTKSKVAAFLIKREAIASMDKPLEKIRIQTRLSSNSSPFPPSNT